jgi:hypothetical protein
LGGEGLACCLKTRDYRTRYRCLNNHLTQLMRRSRSRRYTLSCL